MLGCFEKMKGSIYVETLPRPDKPKASGALAPANRSNTIIANFSICFGEPTLACGKVWRKCALKLSRQNYILDFENSAIL